MSRAVRVPRIVRGGSRRAGATADGDGMLDARRPTSLQATDARAADTVDRAEVDVGPVVRGRLVHVSVAASIRAGAWAGFVLGLLLGAPIGAAVAWLAGALLAWQRDLAFTLGIARNLLPFGDQLGVLRTLSANWAIVVPATAIAVAVLGAIVLGLVGGVLAAAYNATGGHAAVVVELDEDESPQPPSDHPGVSGG